MTVWKSIYTKLEGNKNKIEINMNCIVTAVYGDEEYLSRGKNGSILSKGFFKRVWVLESGSWISCKLLLIILLWI